MASESRSAKPYGFIIFRGDYSDDAQWERYMAYLKYWAKIGLEDENLAHLYDRIDWKVIVRLSKNCIRDFYADFL